ncbi:unnamed protein product, partial [Rotaria sp. Silwood2]
LESSIESSLESSLELSFMSSSLDESNNENSQNTSDERARDPESVNVLSLKSLLIRHRRTEVPIFKYGAVTCLTMGFIEAIDISATIDGILHHSLIEVKWSEGIEFAENGDSGSLYFIFDWTASAFVPLGLHIGSKGRSSYGILLSYIFQELVEKQYKFLICDSTSCQEH